MEGCEGVGGYGMGQWRREGDRKLEEWEGVWGMRGGTMDKRRRLAGKRIRWSVGDTERGNGEGKEIVR